MNGREKNQIEKLTYKIASMEGKLSNLEGMSEKINLLHDKAVRTETTLKNLKWIIGFCTLGLSLVGNVVLKKLGVI